MIGTRKGIYHSELARFGPAFVLVTSDVCKSKKKDNNGNDSYFLVVNHEGAEQYYNIENQAIAQSLKGLKGQQVTLTASGGREDAAIKVNGGTASVPERPVARPDEPGVSGQPVDPVNALRHGLMRVVNAFYVIEKAVKVQVDQAAIDGIVCNEENFGGKCAQAYRTLDSWGLIRGMPDKPLWGAKEQLKEPEEEMLTGGEEPW